MRSMKRGLAILLAVLLIIPTMPVSAEEEPAPSATAVDAGESDAGNKLENPAEEDEKQPDLENKEEEVIPKETPESAPPKEEKETESPEPVESPETAIEPETTTAPEGTAIPEASDSPVPTSIPDADDSPEVSVSPEVTASPEASVAPETTASPQGTASPAASASPSASATPTASASPSATPLLDISEADEILFNTGNHAWSVVTKEAFDQEMGDGYYEEDGSYTINIPEENPFFPYEVQFTRNGEVTNQWFMTPDDSVKVGDHTFYVSAYFDGTAVTQLSLNVAGDTVIVWPEEKEFTDDGDGAMENSLLPLEWRNLRVDLSGYTPTELTMVSAREIFSGDTLADTDKIVWKYSGDDYTISSSGDKLDLSLNTHSPSQGWWGGTTRAYYNNWEMIVGEADQLAAANIRYNVQVQITKSDEWFSSNVYTQDSTGNRKEIFVSESEYRDYDKDDRNVTVYASSKEMSDETQVYVNLNINPAVFGSTKFDSFKIYEGKFATASEAMAGTDITDQICCGDMTQVNAGYLVEKDNWNELTMVTFAGGNVTGCLPFELQVMPEGNYISFTSLFERTDSGRNYVGYTSSSSYADGCMTRTVMLQDGYPVDGTYYQTMSYYRAGVNSSSAVTAAYVGQYSSIAEAASSGAADIKGSLFSTDYNTGGYGADYSQGVYFTIFVGEDGTAEQEIYRYCIKTTPYVPREPSLRTGTYINFYGLNNEEGKLISSFVIDEDSYGENNYITILVNSDADLTRLAPLFNFADGATVHVEGSSTPEVSGESVHDFSGGPIQYGVTSEDHNNTRQCWLKVMKASDGAGQLYINSLEDPESNTRVEGGVTYSTRQMLLDGYHNYEHDILVVNRGTASIPSLGVELQSDVVQLDEYWTLSGNHELSGFGSLDRSNLAKLRITAKEGVAAGTDVSGTLTLKSGDTVLMVLELTGTVGDPCITTEDIPEAVKYVPYGPLIMSNNKYYSWNKVSFYLEDGVLPAGMEVKQNGEIYGVPAETGDFTFTVRMDNSYSSFRSSYKTYTLSVLENTDVNVDNATDTGYELTQRVQNIYLSTSGSPDLSENRRTLVSQGQYEEFKYIFLDGVKLTEGVDYTSSSGSTRITIMWQTLLSGNASKPGTHTLGIEFRNGDDEILQRAAQNFVVEQEEDNSGGNTGDETDNNANSSNGLDNGGGSDGSSSDNAEAGNAGGAAGTADAAVGALTGNTSANNQAVVPGTNPVVSYTVESGDSLWRIAEKYFGDGNFWRKIYAENAEVVGSDPNKLQVGMVLTIYLNQGDGSMITAVSADGTMGNSYTVQRGDTLWKIALKVYGRGWRWRRIYDANTDKISDPGQIYVGQVLFIPE